MQAARWIMAGLDCALVLLGVAGHRWATARFPAGTAAARVVRLFAGWLPAAFGAAGLTHQVPSLLGAPDALVLAGDAAGGLFLAAVFVTALLTLRRLGRSGAATG